MSSHTITFIKKKKKKKSFLKKLTQTMDEIILQILRFIDA